MRDHQPGLQRYQAEPTRRMMKNAETLVEALAQLPDDPARGFRFISRSGEERFYSFQALHQRMRQRALQLQRAGVRRSDRLAIIVADPEQFVITFLGAVLAGIVAVPLFSREGGGFRAKAHYRETVSQIVAAADADALITPSAYRTLIDEALMASALKRVTVIELETLDQLPAEGTLVAPPQPDDLCFLQFTSGSTSQPKGVMVTHRNLIANAALFYGPDGLDIGPNDTVVSWLPLYHDMGLIGFVLDPLICAVPTVLMATERFIRRPKVWLEALTHHHGTVSFAPNFAYDLVTRHIRDRDLAALDLSKVRALGCASEPISSEVLRRFVERFTTVGLQPKAMVAGYGMAEATLAITCQQPGEAMVIDRVDPSGLLSGRAAPVTTEGVELVGCGQAYPGQRIQIVDDQGNPLPERQIGQILIHGVSVTQGYFNQPEKSAETFRDGWLWSGDLGYLADSKLFICGRCKDLIIINGSNYYPQDIELPIVALDDVKRGGVAAFGTLSKGREVLVICVEGRGDVESLKRAVVTVIFQHFGLQVEQVVVVKPGGLPRTSSGKIQHIKAKTLFEKGEL